MLSPRWAHSPMFCSSVGIPVYALLEILIVLRRVLGLESLLAKDLSSCSCA